MAERELVVRLRAGDPGAFETLMIQYADRLTRFAFYSVGSLDSAEDVVQQVFIELWERRASLDPSHLKAFLYRATRNRALNERRAKSVRERYAQGVHNDAMIGGPVASVPSHEASVLAAETFRVALKQLPERRQLAVRLRLEEEMTHAEIAEVLEISPMAAQSLVARAILDLRDILWGD